MHSLAATTGQEALACDARIVAALSSWLAAGASELVIALLAHAPSLDVQRHLWRLLARRAARPLDDAAALGMRLFAIPLVVVTGVRGGAQVTAMLPAELPDVRSIETLLIEHRALGGSRTFTLFGALVAADAIDLPRLPRLMQAAHRFGDGAGPLDLAAAPLHVPSGESAHLRFLVGSVLAGRDVDPLAARDTSRWGMPLSRALTNVLGAGDVSALVLPRAAASLPAAVAQGRAAQREVAAQLFASNALRELRASFGEPVAVISAHVCADVPAGGELRLSLSSPLSPRDAQGFRCALHPGERVADVVAMLTGLLAECRVADVRLVDGVHPDRDPLTGGPLLFKPETLPPHAPVH
jgi:hypothetical protein